MTHFDSTASPFEKQILTLPNGDKRKISGLLEELHVELVEAIDLPQMDVSYDPADSEMSATCDAYAVVRFGNEVRKSKIIKSTLNPRFEEIFTFTLSNPANLREEILRLMSELTTLHIELFDHDENGSSEFIGYQTIQVECLRNRKDERYSCVDMTLDLKSRQGVEETGVARGKIRIRAAIRQGKQCEILARIRGPGWLNDCLLMQALESIPQFFAVGDPEVVTSLVRVLDNRNVQPLSLAPGDLRMLKEVGIPLGINSSVLEDPQGLLGPRLLTMINKGIPLIAATTDDPRDLKFQTIRTHWKARLLATIALSRMALRGEKSAVQTILKLISDESADVRTSAVEALGRLSPQGDFEVLQALIKCIADDSICVREAVVLALHSVSPLNDHRTTSEICAHLDDERDGVRNAAISALKATCSVGFSVAIMEVSARFESPSQKVRDSAAAAINMVAGVGNRTAIVEIINRLQHPQGSVRLCALQALSTCSLKGDKFTIAALTNLLEHPDWNVRQSAVGGIVAHSHSGDLAVIHVVAERIKVDIDSPSVLEGATFVSVPTNAAKLGTEFNCLDFHDDLPDSQFVFTPRMPSMMPLRREIYSSLHLPLLPADPQEPSIACMWWKAKCAEDKARHRYGYSGPNTRISVPVYGPENHPRKNQVAMIQSQHVESGEFEHTVPLTDYQQELHSARCLVLSTCQKLLNCSRNSALEISLDSAAFLKALKRLLKDDDLSLAQTWNWRRLFPIQLDCCRNEVIDFTLAWRIIQLHKRERLKLEAVLAQVRKKMALSINLGFGTLKARSSSMLADEETNKIPEKTQLVGTVPSWACDGTLSIKVLDAKNLPCISSFGSCDSYVKIDIEPHDRHCRTNIRLQSTDPVWNEVFEFPLDENIVTNSVKQFKQPKLVEELEIPSFVESRIGLYFDLKVCIPQSSEEWNISKKGLLIKIVAEISNVNQDQAMILRESRVSSRELMFIIRIITLSFFNTLTVLGNVSEKDFGVQIESAGFFDQRHLLEVSAEYLTSVDELLACSSVVIASVWQNNLRTDDILIGKVSLPLAPLLFSVMAQGNQLELCFDISEERLPIPKFESVDLHACSIQLSFHFTPQQNFSASTDLNNISSVAERARLFLSQAIRRCAIETLVMICGDSRDFTVDEIMKSFEKRSPRVHNSARDALRSISNAGHSMGSMKVLLCSEDEWIVSSSLDSTIKVWSLRSGKVLHTLRCHDGPVLAIAFHPVQRAMLISIGVDGLMCIHNVNNMERVFSARLCRGNISLMDISVDGGTFVICQSVNERTYGNSAQRQSENVSLWTLIWPFQHDVFEGKKPNDDSILLAQALASCHHHSKLDQRFADAYRIQERMVLSGSSATSAIAALPQKSGFDPFSAEWKELAECTLHHIYECIKAGKQPDVPVWSKTLILKIRREFSVPQVARVAMTSSDHSKVLMTVDFVGDIILGMEFDPHDNSKVATCASDGKVRIWKLVNNLKSLYSSSGREAGQSIDQLSDNPIQIFKQFRAHSSPVYAIAFHPLYRDILFTAGQTIKAWNLFGSAVCVGQLAFLHRPSSTYVTAVSAADSFLAGGNDSGDIAVWSLDSSMLVAHGPVKSRELARPLLVGNLRIRVSCHSAPVTSIALEYKGSNSIGISSSQDRTVAVWSSKTGELLHLLTGDSYPAGKAGNSLGGCLESILLALESPNEGIRRAVATCLPEAAERGDPAVVLRIIVYVGSDREEVREAALLALEAISAPGDATAVVAAAAHLMSPSISKQEAAARAVKLVLAGEDQALDVLLQLSRRLCGTRRSSAETFATVAAEVFLRATERIDLSDEDAAGFLARWDGERDWGVRLLRLAALQCHLQALETRAHPATLASWLRYPDADVWALTRRALEEYADSASGSGLNVVCELLPAVCSVPSAPDRRRTLAAVGAALEGLLLRRVEAAVGGWGTWEQDQQGGHSPVAMT